LRIAILGNSGSGKSTLARRLSGVSGAPVLDLDSVAWEPGQVAVARSTDPAEREVGAFCERHSDWIIEGCYAYLIEVALRYQPHLIFLNPGEEACIEHCRQRPWEPHKYASETEQQALLPMLTAWVREYYTRAGDMSLRGHREVYEAYAGSKEELLGDSDAQRAASALIAG
jgi:adenylate kinase family enzyme